MLANWLVKLTNYDTCTIYMYMRRGTHMVLYFELWNVKKKHVFVQNKGQ